MRKNLIFRLCVAAGLAAGSIPLIEPVAELVPGSPVESEVAEALAPPPPGCSYGLSGSAGGSVVTVTYDPAWPTNPAGQPIAPDGEPAMAMGQVANVGAHTDPCWGVPIRPNFSRATSFCIMESIAASDAGAVLVPNPAMWDDAERSAASAVIQLFAGDLVHPYASSTPAGQFWDWATGEFDDPRLIPPGGGEPTRDRMAAVGLAIRHHLEDQSPPVGPGSAFHGTKIKPGAIVGGNGPAVARFQNVMAVSHEWAAMAEQMSATGGITVVLQWRTPDGLFPMPQPTTSGLHRVRISVIDSTGKPVAHAPVLQWRDGNEPAYGERSSTNAVANVIEATTGGQSYLNGRAAGWPNYAVTTSLVDDSRFMVNNPGGGVEWDADAAGTTNANGYVEFNVDISDGNYELAFTALAPGGEVELYEGAGSQGNVTTAGGFQFDDVMVENEVLGSFQIDKTSDLAGFGVAGTEFVAEDANGVNLNAYSPTNGEVDPACDCIRWLDVPTGTNPGAYEVYEVQAPDHFVDPDPTTPVATFNNVSDNSNNPTQQAVINVVRLADVSVRKRFADGESPPPGETPAGFDFSVEHLDQGVNYGVHTTDDSGVTPIVLIPAGLIEVCEVSVPTWAEAVTTGPGCVQYVVAPGQQNEAIEFVFENTIHDFDVASQASVPVAEPGETVREFVWLRDSVPGRALNVHVGMYAVDADVALADVTCTNANEIASRIGLVPGAAGDEQVIAVTFSDPPTTAGMRTFFAGRVLDVGTGRVVAELPCGDPDEAISWVNITTAAPAAIEVSADPVAIDRRLIEGLPTDADGELLDGWTATATYDLYAAEPVCDASTSTFVGTASESITRNGYGPASVGVEVVDVGVPHYFVESLTIQVDRTATPIANGPWTIVHPDLGDQLVFEATVQGEHCTMTESFASPSITSQASTDLIGPDGELADEVTLVGFGDIALPAAMSLAGGLYVHDPSTPIGERVCGEENLVAERTIFATGDGTYPVEPVAGIAEGTVVSWAWTLAIDRPNQITGENDRIVFAQHGCNDANQTAARPGLASQVDAPLIIDDRAVVDSIDVYALDPELLNEERTAFLDVGLYRHGPDTLREDRVCDDTNRVATQIIDIDGQGNYLTDPIDNLATGFVYSFDVGLNLVEPDTSNDAEPDATVTVESVRHGCTVETEAVYVPAMSSRHTFGDDPQVGDDGHDILTVTPLPVLADGWTLRAVGGLYRHPFSSAFTDRTCDEANRVIEIDAVLDAESDEYSVGGWTVPEQTAAWSYAEVLILTDPDGEEIISEQHGCQEPSQSFRLAQSANPPSGGGNTPPSGGGNSPPSGGGRIVSVGTDFTRYGVAVGAVILLVGGIVFMSTRRRWDHSQGEWG